MPFLHTWYVYFMFSKKCASPTKCHNNMTDGVSPYVSNWLFCFRIEYVSVSWLCKQIELWIEATDPITILSSCCRWVLQGKAAKLDTGNTNTGVGNSCASAVPPYPWHTCRSAWWYFIQINHEVRQLITKEAEVAAWALILKNYRVSWPVVSSACGVYISKQSLSPWRYVYRQCPSRVF